MLRGSLEALQEVYQSLFLVIAQRHRDSDLRELRSLVVIGSSATLNTLDFVAFTGGSNCVGDVSSGFNCGSSPSMRSSSASNEESSGMSGDIPAYFNDVRKSFRKVSTDFGLKPLSAITPTSMSDLKEAGSL